MNFRNVFKKNQMIVYAMAFMLVVAGYFNYTANVGENEVETSVQEISDSDIGEAATETNTASKEDKNNEPINKNDNKTALVPNEESVKANSENSKNETNGSDLATLNKDKVAEIGDATLVNSSDVVADDYFAKSKIERDAMYSQMLETYQTILNSHNSAEAQKERASVEMAKINETKNSIMICENLLETKGFKNCIIFVNAENVSVVVGSKDLKPDQTAQIQNIITRELGAIIENIHISTK